MVSLQGGKERTMKRFVPLLLLAGLAAACTVTEGPTGPDAATACANLTWVNAQGMPVAELPMCLPSR
jgi:hypothetical protein